MYIEIFFYNGEHDAEHRERSQHSNIYRLLPASILAKIIK